MQSVQSILSFLHQPKLIPCTEDPFTAPDRATWNLIRARAEQIEVARRYWACPF
jgi:ABC-type uncharacterized transport system ATPase subunit